MARVVLDQVSKQVGRADRHRKPRRGWRNTRRQRRRQSRAGRLHDTGDRRLGICACALSEPAVRHVAGFRAGDSAWAATLVLVTAPAKGFRTLGDLIAAAKARARSVEFRLRGHWLGLALRGRTPAHQRRVRGSAHAFQGRDGSINEVLAGRVDFFCVPPTPALSLINEGKLARSRSARRSEPCLAECADNDGSRIGRLGLRLLGRIVPAGEDSARDRRARLHRETEKALQTAFRAGAAGERRLRADADEPEQFDNISGTDVEANVRLVKTANIVTQ